MLIMSVCTLLCTQEQKHSTSILVSSLESGSNEVVNCFLFMSKLQVFLSGALIIIAT